MSSPADPSVHIVVENHWFSDKADLWIQKKSKINIINIQNQIKLDTDMHGENSLDGGGLTLVGTCIICTWFGMRSIDT